MLPPLFRVFQPLLAEDSSKEKAAVNKNKREEVDMSKFDWVQFHHDMTHAKTGKPHNETAGQKFKRKFADNPFIPIGALATALALAFGIRAFFKKDVKMSQKMMRARVGAQGFTVLALLTGVWMDLNRRQKKAELEAEGAK